MDQARKAGEGTKQENDGQGMDSQLMNWDRKTFIYFARECRTGLVKIGRSIDPARRAYQIMLQEKCGIELLGEFKCHLHAAFCERSALLMFAEKHVRGEWFRINQADVDACILKLGAMRTEDIPWSRFSWPRLPWRVARQGDWLLGK